MTEGLSVSLGDFLEHPDIQGLIGDDLFQPIILVLRGFHPLGLFALHATVLRSPAAQRGFTDLQALQHLTNALADSQHGVGVTQLLDHLLGRVACLFLAQ